MKKYLLAVLLLCLSQVSYSHGKNNHQTEIIRLLHIGSSLFEEIKATPGVQNKKFVQEVTMAGRSQAISLGANVASGAGSQFTTFGSTPEYYEFYADIEFYPEELRQHDRKCLNVSTRTSPPVSTVLGDYIKVETYVKQENVSKTTSSAIAQEVAELIESRIQKGQTMSIGGFETLVVKKMVYLRQVLNLLKHHILELSTDSNVNKNFLNQAASQIEAFYLTLSKTKVYIQNRPLGVVFTYSNSNGKAVSWGAGTWLKCVHPSTPGKVVSTVPYSF